MQRAPPPSVVRQVSGTLSVRRPDADRLGVTALDLHGYARQELDRASEIRLLPDRLGYIIGP